ncbi:MAG: pseudouridine synthase [Leptolyngbya foveolarum]|uniref:Pseudouridine synthase n=1 Tax=Leptolyngbya foveolarum TaxID=47253 RepID=A0A2W4VU00_9CYAN|nr:MAG: pseudouridine synthase [Leptolyngbya foveolarum]
MSYRYLLLYKPYDVLSQFTDAEGRRSLKEFVPVPDVYAVGRLDRDSEGLLLLTDDGPMQHRLSHPKFAHGRRYWAQVEREPTPQSLAQLRSGVTIKDYRTRPAIVERIAEPDLPHRDPPIRYRQHIPTAWLALTLTEGKNRQVRRMTAAVGFPTLRLVRSALLLPQARPLTLDGLQPGEWRELTADEVRSLPQS